MNIMKDVSISVDVIFVGNIMQLDETVVHRGLNAFCTL